MNSANERGASAGVKAAQIGVIGVGALASALVQAWSRASPACQFHLSPRGALASELLAAVPGAMRHGSNQAVADRCDTLIIGVRPQQLQALSNELHLRPAHHLLALSAGTPRATLERQFAPARISRVMTGLAVAGGQSAISIFPAAEDVAALLAPAGASLVRFEDEAQFEASMMAVCVNAWWLDQLAALTDWFAGATGMSSAQAQALLCANLSDVPTLLKLNPQLSARELARAIGSPGTYTALGLDHLQQAQAHQPWEEALTRVQRRSQGPNQ